MTSRNYCPSNVKKKETPFNNRAIDHCELLTYVMTYREKCLNMMDLLHVQSVIVSCALNNQGKE